MLSSSHTFILARVTFLFIPKFSLSANKKRSAPTNVVFSVLVFTTLFIRSGVATKLAHVAPVAVPASNSTCVATSTLPATVVLAFACVLHPLTATHAPPIY